MLQVLIIFAIATSTLIIDYNGLIETSGELLEKRNSVCVGDSVKRPKHYGHSVLADPKSQLVQSNATADFRAVCSLLSCSVLSITRM